MDPNHIKNLVFQVHDSSTPIYKDIQSTIELNTLMSLFILSTINIFLLTIDPVKLRTTTKTENIGTKISSGPLLERQYS